MHHDAASLSALIGSRICHDLINPIGAISNGLELVAMTPPDPASPEMTLIQQSCANAAARIRFFRIAFGSDGDTQPIPEAIARITLADHYAGMRLRPNWQSDAGVGRHIVQLAFLAVLCLESALTQGGDVNVVVTDSSLTAEGTGPVAKRDDALWSLLSQTTNTIRSPLRPAHVQFALMAQLCADRHLSPSSAFEVGQVRLHIPLTAQSR